MSQASGISSKTSDWNPLCLEAKAFAQKLLCSLMNGQHSPRRALMLILAAMLGETRFGGFAERTGLASRLVTSRLRTLESLGILIRVPYALRPLRHEYMLTVMGRDLLPVMLQMTGWEQRWASTQKDRDASILHVACGKRLRPILACKACGEPATARDIAIRISRSQLPQMPVKQTLHRRASLAPTGGQAGFGLIDTSLTIFGDKWTVEIINCSFLRVRRFSEFRRYTGIAANILADRLERLVAQGIFRTREHGSREYRLTEAGVDLYGILVALRDWADIWVQNRYRSPVQLIHKGCGQAFFARSSCTHCGVSVDSLSAIQFQRAVTI